MAIGFSPPSVYLPVALVATGPVWLNGNCRCAAHTQAPEIGVVPVALVTVPETAPAGVIFALTPLWVAVAVMVIVVAPNDVDLALYHWVT